MIDPGAAKAAAGTEHAAGADQAKAAKASGDNASGAEKTSKLDDGGAGAKAKAFKANGVERTENPDGTYTLKGKLANGTEWSKTFVDTNGSTHAKGNPDSSYIGKVKAHLSKGLNGDEPGQDTNGDGQYGGKSLELGKGGRAKMMHDRITMELVNKGYAHEDASSIAKKQVGENAIRKYGADQVNSWKSANKAAKA